MGVRVTQGVAEVLRDGAPHGRLTQGVAEVLRDGAPHGRLTQGVAEVLRDGAPLARLTQGVAEVLRSTHTAGALVSESVADAIAVAPRVGGDDYQRMSHAVAVAPSGRRIQRPVPIAIVDAVAVAPAPVAGPTNHKVVADAIAVGQACFGRNNHVRIGVTTSIAASVPTLEYDDHNRRSVVDTVTIDSTPRPVTNQAGEAVADPIAVRSWFTSYTNPSRILVGHRVVVDESIGGGRGDRDVLVIDEVAVGDVADPKRPAILVRDDLVVAKSEAGGGPRRSVSVLDAVAVADAPSPHGTGPALALLDRIDLSQACVARTPRVPVALVDAVAVSQDPRPVGPRTAAVADAVAVGDVVADPHVTVNRQLVFDAASVSDAVHQNLVDVPVSHLVAVAARPSTTELTLIHRVLVAPTHRRDFDATLVDALTFAESTASPMVRTRSLLDPLPILETTARGSVWTRSLADLLVIPDATFKRRISLPDPVDVPVAYGGLVTKYCTLQSKGDAIVLPAPLLGDGRDNVDAALVHRSMNGGTLVHATSSIRRRIRYTFRLEKLKAFELRLFLAAHLSETITLTTHDAQVWAVQIPRSPFEIQHAGRSAPAAGEFATVELELEGTKISG